MIQCRQCGANLPEQSRFCLQCGAPVQPQQISPEGRQAPLDFVQPALAGGMFLGVLSSLPFVSALCCVWVPVGGAIAAFLVTKQRPTAIRTGDGAFAGVLSGVFGALVGTVISIPVRILMARFFEPRLAGLEEMLSKIGADSTTRDLILRMASAENSVQTVAFTLLNYLLVYTLFAMIGGIVYVAVLNKRQKGL